MKDADYTDNLAFLTNKTVQAESQLHSLKRAAGSIDFYMNSNKTELLCFKQEGVITKWQNTKISRPVYMLQLQYLIYWK